jgi:ABC-type branched-subunit amino acid transport system ATPase component
MPRPSLFQGNESFYFLMVLILLAVVGGFAVLHRSRLGRSLRGMADSPDALQVLGLSLNVTKVIVFCISAALASLSGVLYGCAVNFAGSSDTFFTPITAITLLAILALAPVAEPWYALFGLLAAVIPGYLTSGNTTYWLQVLFGVSAIQVGMAGGTAPMAQWLRRLLDRLDVRRPGWLSGSAHDVAAAAPTAVLRGQGEPGLMVEDLTVRFGGLVAVRDVSLDVPRGRVTGLIGPNGAGKTTTFNACSGLNRPSSGKITFAGRDLSSLPPWARAQRGIGRTFQIMQLCDSLTVAENVEFGSDAWQAGANLWKQLAASRSERRTTKAATRDAMELCGITDLAGTQAGALSTGQRRLVELARCLAGPFELLLLDEPSSGLDARETEQFGEVIRHVVSERGVGVLLVEHDMSLVMDICEHLYVLDFGSLIFEGTPVEVSTSPVVQRAYLGSTELTTLASEVSDGTVG